MIKLQTVFSTPATFQDEGASPTIQEKSIEEDTSEAVLSTQRSIELLGDNPIKMPKLNLVSKTSADPEYNLEAIFNKKIRTDSEGLFLYNYLKEFKFFTQFIENIDEHEREEAVTYICKKLQYETFEPGSVILKQGEFSDGKVYITLSGELFVLVNTIGSPTKVDTALDKDKEKETPKEEKKDQIERLASKDQERGKNSSPRDPTAPKDNISIGVIMDKKNLKKAAIAAHYRNDTIQSPNKPSSIPSLKGLDRIDSSRKPEKEAINLTGPAKMHIATTLQTLISARNIDFDNYQSLASPEKESPDKRNVEAELIERNLGVIVNKIYRGSYFGERALFNRHKRTATIVANSFVELLTLHIDDFQYVQSEFNKTKKLIMQFLRDIFPNLDKIQTPILLENLSYTCDVKNSTYNNKITLEGECGDLFYVVYEGKCEVIKTLIYDRSDNLSPMMAETKSLYRMRKTRQEDIVILTLEKGMFFGEEILFNPDPTYEYTVRISSEKAKLLCFKKSKFLYKCPKIVLQGLSNVYAGKKERIKKGLLEILEKKGTKASMDVLEEIKPKVALPKSIITYGPDLHHRRSSSSLMSRRSSNVPRLSSIFVVSPRISMEIEEDENGSPPIKPLQITPSGFPHSPFEEEYSYREPSDLQQQSLLKHLSTGLRILSQPQSRASPLNLKSAGPSPKASSSSGAGHFHFIYSKNNNGGSRKQTPEKGKNGSEIVETNSKPAEPLINNIKSFKANFGRMDKTMEKKYRAYKVKRGLIKTTTNFPELNKGSNLADYLTLKLKEKKFIKKASQITESLSSSPRSRRQSPLADSPEFKLTGLPVMEGNINEHDFIRTQLQTSKYPMKMDFKKFTFMQDLASFRSNEYTPRSNNVQMIRKGPEIAKPLVAKPLVTTDESKLRRTQSQKKIEKLKFFAPISPSVIQMELNYSSGLSAKTLREYKNRKDIG